MKKREITCWEARTTGSQKATLELTMSLEAVDKLAGLWGAGNDEDKQEMARSLSSYVVFDLDSRRIVDFRLKPWADRFLVLRSALYAMGDDPTDSGNSDNSNNIASDTPESGEAAGNKLDAPDMTSKPSEATSGASSKMAAQRLLRLLYPNPKPKSPKKKDEANRDVRNEEICRRYDAGERVVALAQEHGMTIQAVYKILCANRQ